MTFFILRIHMVTQLDSLIRVEVHFVKETIEQVSIDSELVWTLKINSQTASFTEFVELGLNNLNLVFSFHVALFGN